MPDILNQYSIPLQKPRNIRVFLSSTFKDMEMERSELVNLFKGLQTKAASHGVSISLVDLRWGITEEDAQNSKVVEICLKEIIHSRPFFIGLVGDRYGWCPSEEEVPSSLFRSSEYSWIKDDIKQRLSVTEMEMQFGVLRNPNPLHAYFYLKVPSPQATDDNADEDSRKLKRLKECILRQDRYPVIEYTTPRQLCDLVESDFTRLLEQEYPETITIGENQELQEQVRRHELLDNYHPLAEADSALIRFVADAHRSHLIVTGEAGIGKSALMAHWSNMVSEQPMQWIPIYHYLDSSALASRPKMLIKALANKCKRAIGREHPEMMPLFLSGGNEMPVSADAMTSPMVQAKLLLGEFTSNTLRNFDEMREDSDAILQPAQLWDALAKSKLPVILFIDNPLRVSQKHRSLYSLLGNLPANVKVVLSFPADSTAYTPFVQNGAQTYQLQGFTPVSVPAFAGQYLAGYSKALSPRQEEMISAWSLARFPLCLKVLLDELVSFGSFEKLNDRIESYCRNSQTVDFYEQVLHRLATDYNTEQVARTLSLLTLTLKGFTENEIKELAGISQLQWSQLKIEMQSWLTIRNGCHSITDRLMQEAVSHCFTDNNSLSIRQEIESYLLESEGMNHELTFADYNHRLKQFCYHDFYRYILEITYQRYRMQRWKQLAEWILNPQNFEVLYRSDYQLLVSCWKAIMDAEPSLTPKLYAEQRFDLVDSYLRPVITNDIASLLSQEFNDIETAVAMGDKSFESDDLPPIAQSVLTMNKGCKFANNEQYDRACEWFLKALAQQEGIEPTPEREIADTCYNLGMAYYWQRMYDDAHTFFDRTIQFYAGHPNEKNAEYWPKALNFKAYIHYNRNEYEDAIRLFKEVASIYEKREGHWSVNVAKNLHMQALSLYYADRDNEAWTVACQALETAIAISHDKTISECHKLLYKLCNVFRKEKMQNGDKETADLWFSESLLHDAFFNESPLLDERHLRYEALWGDLVQRYYYDCCDYDSVLRITDTLNRHDYASNPEIYCDVLALKAQALAKKEKYAEAKEAYASELELHKKYNGWTDDAITACRNLGVMHSICNEPQEALACLQEAYGHEVEKNGADSQTAQKLLQMIEMIS